jgi:hypothetical protein
MTMHAVAENLSPRQIAARKAWDTMRARRAGGQVIDVSRETLPRQVSRAASTGVDNALELFKRAKRDDDGVTFDWRGIAEAMALSLTTEPTSRRAVPAHTPTPLTEKSTQAPLLADYPVKSGHATSARLTWPSPVLTVEFADGEIVRAPAVSIKGKPTNVCRGLRIASAYYQARKRWRLGIVGAAHVRGIEPPVPAIALCRCEDTGETWAGDACTAATVDARAAGALWTDDPLDRASWLRRRLLCEIDDEPIAPRWTKVEP